MVKIEIPMVKKVSTNAIYAGVHWAERLGVAKKYHAVTENAVRIAGLKQFDMFPLKIELCFLFDGRCLDVDNCTFMGKCVVDGLKNIICDDSPKYVSQITYKVQKYNENKIVVIIKEMSEV